MKIVFDAYWWAHGPAAVRRVLREVVLTWRNEFPEDELVLVVRKRHLEAVDAPAGVAVVASMSYPQAVLAHWTAGRIADRAGADAVVVHNFAARSRKAVSTVYLHDVLFETNPEWFTPVERRYFSLMTRWAPRADVVFATSLTEAARIRAHTRSTRVVQVGLGLSSELTGSSDQAPVDGLDPERFLLTVGRLNVRKNLAGAIRGALASGSVSADFPLVVVGGANGKSTDLDDEARTAIDTGAVRILGHVSDPQLRWLYSHSAVFLYLSLGEGFGMPPAEAKWFGARSIVSDLPVFRESVGEYATFVDPLVPEAIGAAIRDQLEALERPSTSEVAFTWEKTVSTMRAEIARELRERRSTPG